MNRRKFINLLGIGGLAILPVPKIKVKNEARNGKLYTVDEKQYCFFCGDEKDLFPFQMYVSETDVIVRMAFRCKNLHGGEEKGKSIKDILTDRYVNIGWVGYEERYSRKYG